VSKVIIYYSVNPQWKSIYSESLGGIMSANFESDYYIIPWAVKQRQQILSQITTSSRAGGRWFNGGSSWRNQYHHPNSFKLTKVSSTNSIVSWHRFSPAVTVSKARSKARSQAIGLFLWKHGKRDLWFLLSSSFWKCLWRLRLVFIFNGPWTRLDAWTGRD